MLDNIQPPNLLTKATTTQTGLSIGMRIFSQAIFQASIEGTSGTCTATVLLYGSNDPTADTSQVNSANCLLTTFSLSGTGLGAGISCNNSVYAVLAPYRKFWAQVTAIGGTGTAVSVWAAV